MLLAGAAAPIEGLWLTEERTGVIRIAPCGEQLCGSIVGMAKYPGGKDVSGRPQCNLEIIHSLQEVGAGTWDGTITNPETGSTFGARLTLDGQGQLLLRGYLWVSLFGATQTWTRYTGGVTPDCRMQP